MMITDALAPLSVPVCHPPYSGAARKFITYQSMGQTGTIYAEGEEAETASSFALDLYTDGGATENDALVKRIKALLWEAGYMCVVNAEIHEKDTGLRHYAMTAETVEELYG